ncbi:MAG: hypothetical protein IPK76_13045, partial [Lewinellaceae bacterium]|nr:hypothetical protein [Lewinellaceae bacterium]
KIGYKGIGFKSVFNLAKRVWIWSQDYRFRFDQEHWQDRLPWQFMPVWSETEDFPTEISTMLEDGWVTFVLELTDPTLRRQYRDQFRKAVCG